MTAPTNKAGFWLSSSMFSRGYLAYSELQAIVQDRGIIKIGSCSFVCIRNLIG